MSSLYWFHFIMQPLKPGTTLRPYFNITMSNTYSNRIWIYCPALLSSMTVKYILMFIVLFHTVLLIVFHLRNDNLSLFNACHNIIIYHKWALNANKTNNVLVIKIYRYASNILHSHCEPFYYWEHHRIYSKLICIWHSEKVRFKSHTKIMFERWNKCFFSFTETDTVSLSVVGGGLNKNKFSFQFCITGI